MSSLIGRFERDVLYLEQGEVPREISGQEVKALKYDAEPEKTKLDKEKKKKDKDSGSEKDKESEKEAEAAEVHERLTDEDIARLSNALIHNGSFTGPLEL